MGYGHPACARGVCREVESIVRNNHLRGIALAAGGAAIISFDGLLIRIQALSSAGVTFWRGVMTGLAFGTVLLVGGWRRKRSLAAEPTQWWPVLALAALMLAGTITFVYSLTQTTVAHTLVIVASSPVLTAILGRVFLNEHLPLRTWLAGVVVLGGVAILVSGSLGTGDIRGDAWAIGNTFVISTILVLLRRYPSLDRAVALTIASFATAAVILPFGIQVPDSRSFAAAAIDGVLIVPIGLLLITLAPRYLPAAEVGLLLLLETILAPMWVLFAIGEALTIPAVVSGAIILGAIAIHSALDLRGNPLRPAEVET